MSTVWKFVATVASYVSTIQSPLWFFCIQILFLTIRNRFWTNRVIFSTRDRRCWETWSWRCGGRCLVLYWVQLLHGNVLLVFFVQDFHFRIFFRYLTMLIARCMFMIPKRLKWSSSSAQSISLAVDDTWLVHINSTVYHNGGLTV